MIDACGDTRCDTICNSGTTSNTQKKAVKTYLTLNKWLASVKPSSKNPPYGILSKSNPSKMVLDIDLKMFQLADSALLAALATKESSVVMMLRIVC